MTYYVFKAPGGPAHVQQKRETDALMKEYVFLYETENDPGDLRGKQWNGSAWVTPAPDYGRQRATEYPKLSDQMDALWHAMDQGILPKVQPMYAQIKAVKDKYPKPPGGSNNGR